MALVTIALKIYSMLVILLTDNQVGNALRSQLINYLWAELAPQEFALVLRSPKIIKKLCWKQKRISNLKIKFQSNHI